MTSLQLSSASFINRDEKPEWGTGKKKEHVPLWTPKPPTWHYSGQPIEQFYNLTQLKKSNVRWNDQLLPKPMESNLGKQMIHKDFPADHPYSSHIPKLKVFPAFAITSEDPKKGVEARQLQPLSSEAPAAPYDVQILQKTKGMPYLHQVQDFPPDSLKRGLSWHGFEGYNQGVKMLGDRRQYYPIPPTSVIPNLMDRRGTTLSMSDSAANATRNLERQQWKTTYERNHSGIGPVNQYKLDNLEDKKFYTLHTGLEDDDIYPWFTNTYDRSRPQTGRIAQVQNPNFGAPTSNGAAHEPDKNYTRKPTLTEKEEHRLLNGTQYVNLPVVKDEHELEQWDSNHPDARFTALVEKQMREIPSPLPFIARGTEPLDEIVEPTYLDKIRKENENSVQQMEAQNRWKQLEVVKPAHDISTLDRKLAISTPTEQPSAFYGHEGKYNEERAGLYKTSYDPSKLSYKLDDDPTKLNMRQLVGSHTDAVHYPTALNVEMDNLRTHSQTDMRKVPMFSERPDVYEVFEPFKRDRHVLNMQLQPNDTNARARVQEGRVILKNSTTGDSYNTMKFLQDYKLPTNVRSEPMSLMSAENQNLANVRVNSTKKVQFHSRITVGEGLGNSPLLVSKADIETPKVTLYSPREPAHPLPDILPKERTADHLAESMLRSSEPFRPATSQDMTDYTPTLTNSDKLFLSQKGKMTASNQFSSKASNIMPGFGTDTMFRKSPNVAVISTKDEDDPRFNWIPGCGVPRPQTSLIKLQNSFSKSDAYRRLQEQFSEKNPNLIDNIDKGRRHEFKTLNAQVLRGTLVTA